MLAGAGVTIAQIADTLHFASSSHFTESFKKITGMTPQQYRIENQQL
jgi:AraC-like DNA-binding protein